MKKSVLLKKIDELKCRSAWERGVKAAAYDMVEDVDAEYIEEATNAGLLEKALLNGATSWDQYSWGGCTLCYNGDIAKRFCSPSELKKTNNGNKRPNAREEWLDVQARALFQASLKINQIVFG